MGKSEAWNLGLDFGFLNNRISGTIEGYSVATRDRLWGNFDAFSGFSSMTTNLGEVSNKGFEVSLTTVNIKTQRWNGVPPLIFLTTEQDRASLLRIRRHT